MRAWTINWTRTRIQEPIGSQDLDEKAKNRHEKRVLDQVRDKVEAKSKNMAKVFRQFDENKDGDISYDEFRLGLRHLGIELSDQVRSQ